MSKSSVRIRSVVAYAWKLSPIGNGGEDGRDRSTPSDRGITEPAELPFQVELWNQNRSQVESVLAITISGGIGYAAYYAAIGVHPDRYITLRRSGKIILRSA